MEVKEESEQVGLKLNIQKTKIMAPNPITCWQIDGETVETVTDFIFLGSKITADGDCSHHLQVKTLFSWKKSYDQPRQHIKKQRHYFVNKGPSSQSYGFPSSHGWMWELDHKESWALKNWCYWTVVLEKTLESSLDHKEIQPVHPKGDQFWGVHWKDWCWSWNSNTLATWWEELTRWKRPWCWERWGQEEKGTTEDEMVGWHHQLDGHESEQAPGDGDGHGSLVCCG